MTPDSLVADVLRILPEDVRSEVLLVGAGTGIYVRLRAEPDHVTMALEVRQGVRPTPEAPRRAVTISCEDLYLDVRRASWVAETLQARLRLSTHWQQAGGALSSVIGGHVSWEW